MRNYDDPKLVGSKIGKWTLLERVNKKIKGRYRNYWLCVCDCGTEKLVREDALFNNRSLSCRKKLCVNNLIGQTFDYLLVKKLSDNSYTERSNGRYYTKTTYDCVCRCGKTVRVAQESLLTGNNKSCGCLKIEKTKQRVREKHPNWKPEISDEERMRRRQSDTPEYTYWRKSVFERDKHRCKLCGKKGRLNAHHIDSWNWAIDLRYSISNGITLCDGKNGCHAKFHKEYGKGDNTRFQFDEFMQKYFSKSLLDFEL